MRNTDENTLSALLDERRRSENVRMSSANQRALEAAEESLRATGPTELSQTITHNYKPSR